MIKGILWDIHGVLYDADFDFVHGELGKRLGVGEERIKAIFNNHIGEMLSGKFTTEDLQRLLKELLGINANMMELFVSVLKEHAVINKKVLDIIDLLRSKTKEVALSNVTEIRDAFDQEVKIYSHFHDYVLSFKSGLVKPNGAFFELGRKKLGCEFSETLFIDNTEKNIMVARDLGMKVILYRDADQLLVELEKLGL